MSTADLSYVDTVHTVEKTTSNQTYCKLKTLDLDVCEPSRRLHFNLMSEDGMLRSSLTS